MILAPVLHVVRGEYHFAPINLVPGGAGEFIACGRSSSILLRSGTGDWRAMKQRDR